MCFVLETQLKQAVQLMWFAWRHARATRPRRQTVTPQPPRVPSSPLHAPCHRSRRRAPAGRTRARAVLLLLVARAPGAAP